MSDKVLIVQNISHEGPGLLLDILHEYSIGFDCCDLSKGALIPDPCSYACVVVLGGPQSANDRTQAMDHELRRVGETLDAGIPCLGICLGLQVMVKAAGGAVITAPVKETGFHEPDGTPYQVTLTPEGRSDLLFRGLQEQLRVFQLHGETVVTAAGMTLLGTGKGCRNQVVRFGERAWGLQCHFEMTRGMFETWTHIDPDLRRMDRKALLAGFDLIRDDYTQTGRKLLLNFLNTAGLAAGAREALQ
ncbi:MAG: type 1 glutamine amidotransferase [Chlorobiaceae bacterium]|nr:type 1 glutamine amidotransferase [Chlorobiaceae bacterium]